MLFDLETQNVPAATRKQLNLQAAGLIFTILAVAALQFVLIGEAAHLDRVVPRQNADITDILTKPLERHSLIYSI